MVRSCRRRAARGALGVDWPGGAQSRLQGGRGPSLAGAARLKRRAAGKEED